MKELDDSTEEEDAVFISEELDPFDSADAPLRVTLLDEDSSLSAELLLDLGCLAEEELSASDADEDESSPHAARNASTKMDPIAAMRLPPWWPCALGNKLPSAVRQDDSTKNFFIKNVIIIPD